MPEIIEFEDRYAAAFRALNLEWLDAYHFTEPHDLEQLDYPREYILDAGGAIFLARLGDEIVGTVALIHEDNGVYEMAKMTVAPAYRGRGISKMLLDRCITKARQLKAGSIILFSSSLLQSALALYEKYGFTYLPADDTPYATADIKMELVITN